MFFVARFYDREGSAELRKKHLAEHLAWLASQRALIPLAGSIRETAEATPLGGVWIISAENRESAKALIELDPFFIAGLRERYELWHYFPAANDML